MSEAKPRFGDDFKIDETNRLNPLHKNEKVPQYVQAGLEVRYLLAEAGKEDPSWKEMPPNIEKVEDFFDVAKATVTKNWNEKVQGVLVEKAQKWATELEAKADSKYDAMISVLRDPQALEEKMRIRQFGVLEPLRNVDGLEHAWAELLFMSSDRQLAEVTVARRWLKSVDAEKNPGLLEKWGLKSKVELELLIDSAALLGKFVDHAYVRQVEFADAPGGSKKTKLAQEKGSRYLYDVYDDPKSDSVTVKSYAEVFPMEFDGLKTGFLTLASKAEEAVKNGILGQEYKKFGPYLRQMAYAYDLRTEKTDKAAKEWDQLGKSVKELADDGCPIMLVPQSDASVAGDAKKVDAEIRLGFISRESRELTEVVNHFRALADEVLKEQRPYMDTDHKVGPIIMNYQPFSFGPNLYWTTRGQAGKDKIVAHTNAVEEVAKTTALPALRRVFVEVPEEEIFRTASILDNALHEVGHGLAPTADDQIKARIGSSSEATAAEELKADVGNMKLVALTLEKGNPLNINIGAQFFGKLGDVCDYLKNKSSKVGTSGERYHTDGVAIIARLIEKKVIVPEGDKFRITDAETGVRELAGLADEILDLYTKGTPEKLQDYINKVRAKKEDPAVAAFLTKLKG